MRNLALVGRSLGNGRGNEGSDCHGRNRFAMRTSIGELHRGMLADTLHCSRPLVCRDNKTGKPVSCFGKKMVLWIQSRVCGRACDAISPAATYADLVILGQGNAKGPAPALRGTGHLLCTQAAPSIPFQSQVSLGRTHVAHQEKCVRAYFQKGFCRNPRHRCRLHLQGEQENNLELHLCGWFQENLLGEGPEGGNNKDRDLLPAYRFRQKQALIQVFLTMTIRYGKSTG